MSAADDAMAALVAARMQLFNASQRREAVVLRRVRIEAPESLDSINQDITDARAAVTTATANLQAIVGTVLTVPGV